MNELTLSTDIKQIELEINYHKQIAGQSIWEIGRRLNHVKENDLAHGQFIEWVKSVGLNHPEANRMMKVADELPNSSTLTNLGSTALYLIATLPEEERSKEQLTSNGETKTPDEMTVKELQELKRQIKLKDSELQSKQQEIEKLSSVEPEIREVPVEVIPDDYKQLKSTYQTLESNKNFYEEQASVLKEEVKQLEDKLKEQTATKKVIDGEMFDEQDQKKLERLKRESEINVYQLVNNINNFVKENAITVYSADSIATASKETKDKLSASLSMTEKLIKEIKQEIGGEVVWVK